MTLQERFNDFIIKGLELSELRTQLKDLESKSYNVAGKEISGEMAQSILDLSSSIDKLEEDIKDIEKIQSSHYSQLVKDLKKIGAESIRMMADGVYYRVSLDNNSGLLNFDPIN